MPSIEGYVRKIREEILPKLRAQLEPLEKGDNRTGEKYLSGPWVDTTERDISRLNKAIAEYEWIATKLSNGSIP